MFKNIKSLLIKYREMINYIFFGVLTTVVSFGSYFILNTVFQVYYLNSHIISWILAVGFAFVTNKRFVFNNNEKAAAGIIVQAVRFYLSRVLSLAVETLLLFGMVAGLKFDENISKIAVSIVTVILNYFTSKFLVFHNRRACEMTDDDKNG